MSWWGKILGGIFGYLIDGPVTALLGAALGHAVDSLGGMSNKMSAKNRFGNRQTQNSAYIAQATFFTSTFSVMGYVCKADGVVSEEEIDVATQIMDSMELTKSQREKAIKLFNEGKSASFPLISVLDKLRHTCVLKKQLVRNFMELQISVAFADGELSASERHLLLEIAQRVGILRMEYERIEEQVRVNMNMASKGAASSTSSSLKDAYLLLGVKQSISDGELKKTYRRLLSQNHPDKLVSQDVNEEKMKQATEKTQQIRQAYEIICNARGI